MWCHFLCGLFVIIHGEAIVVIEQIIVGVGVVGHTGYNEIFGEAFDFPLFHIAFVHKIPKDAEHQGAKEVDKEVLHGVGDADIKVATFDDMDGAVCGDDMGFDNILDADTGLDVVRIKGDGADAGKDDVLLHVHAKEVVKGKFPEFPEYPDGHGEAEGDHGEIER